MITSPSFRRPRPTAAMTLMEVVFALTILAMSMGGIFAALMQSRRLTEGSVVQNAALTIVQGYVEQMKSMDMAELVNGNSGAVDANGQPVYSSGSYPIPTDIDENTKDYLQTTPQSVTIPTITSLTPGTTPTGIVDNLKSFDVKKSTSATTDTSTDTGSAATVQIPWATAWPNAISNTNAITNGVLSTTVGRTDLKLNMWVWVSDLSGTTAQATKVYGITVIYTWQYLDGGKPKYIIGTVRTVRSSVPTF